MDLETQIFCPRINGRCANLLEAPRPSLSPAFSGGGAIPTLHLQQVTTVDPGRMWGVAVRGGGVGSPWCCSVTDLCSQISRLVRRLAQMSRRLWVMNVCIENNEFASLLMSESLRSFVLSKYSPIVIWFCMLGPCRASGAFRAFPGDCWRTGSSCASGAIKGQARALTFSSAWRNVYHWKNNMPRS